MSRHLAKLQVLFQKLESRYGAEDEAVRQVGEQLRTLEQLESARRQRKTGQPDNTARRAAASPRLL